MSPMAWTPALSTFTRSTTLAAGSTAGIIVKVMALEVPPPGAALKTVTLAEPALATSLAEMGVVSWVLLTKVVGRSDPFQRTAEVEMKFVPLTVRVKAAPPAVAPVGEIEVIAGTGFDGVGTGVGACVGALPQAVRNMARESRSR